MEAVTELAEEGVSSELLYADDSVWMSEMMKRLVSQFLLWKEAFDSKTLSS